MALNWQANLTPDTRAKRKYLKVAGFPSLAYASNLPEGGKFFILGYNPAAYGATEPRRHWP